MFKSPTWATFIDATMAEGVAAAISDARLSRYKPLNQEVTNIQIVAEHGRNIMLCEAMYPSLHMLEIVMRNGIHKVFSWRYGATDWYNQDWLLPGHASLIEDAKAELAKRGKQANPDRVVAELTFGFWCGMFNHPYESPEGPWPHLIKEVLPRVPKSLRTRSKIKERLERARMVRNRVFHHECITQFPDLRDRHREIVELIGWFSPESRRHVEHMCRFSSVLSTRLELAENSS